MTLKARGLLGALSWSAATVWLMFACSKSDEQAKADSRGLGDDASAPVESGTSGGSSSSPSNTMAPSATTTKPASEPSAEPEGSDDATKPTPSVSETVNPEPVESSQGDENTEPNAEPESTDAATQPSDTQPSDTQPSDTQPSDTQPSDTQPSEPIVAAPSDGCSASTNPPTGAQTLDVDGTERSYIVSLPEDYDPTVAYPLVFAFHGLGGSAELVSGPYYFGLEQHVGKPTVFVYPDGLDTGDGAGWANTDGQDVAFFDALLGTMQQNYCIDSARVFSTGHSYGGIMSHTLGCERANVLRAIAPVAGAFFGGRGTECTGPIAAWGAHGNPDNTVDYENGLSAIQRVMEVDGCDPDSGTPVEPTDFCVRYECNAGYPVTWCTHGEDHNWPEFAAESIMAFFDSF